MRHLTKRVEVNRLLVARKLVSEARQVRQEIIAHVMALTGLKKRQAQRRIRFYRGKSRLHMYAAIAVFADSAVVHKGRLVPIRQTKERLKGKGSTKMVDGKRRRRSRRAGIVVAGVHYPTGFVMLGKGEKRRLYKRVGKGRGPEAIKSINHPQNIVPIFRRYGPGWVTRVNRRVLRYAISMRTREKGVRMGIR